MPISNNPPAGGLTDTWGRRNRKLADKPCAVCGAMFRPARGVAKYCSRKCATSQNGGRNRKTESWWINSRGYIEGKVWIDQHTQIRVKKHRWVTEIHLGRKLTPEEDVHHKDGNKQNNDISNLEVIAHGAHSTHHNNTTREYKRGYKLNITEESRRARSTRAKAQKLGDQGRAAIAKAEART